ncbi:glucan 1,3-beta-glucosidase A [Martensiomyces pterosporus]|nr:glucan 1,3-beta-glucosidase A [Martensiomyces pterosporus]
MLFKLLLSIAAGTLCIASSAAAPVARRDYSRPPTRGVNLGGLFVLEPWITPSLFKEWESTPNSPAIDEWSYCATLGKDECTRRLHAHWRSWVQETDIRELAGMHINTIRIPIGYWALAPNYTEPYIQGQIPYLKQVLGWATKYQLQVLLDLHGVPGSQNGFDNSGRRGDITWTKRPTDIQRSLDSLTELANIAREFPIVTGIQAVNEPANWGVDKSTIIDYYTQAYSTVRSIAPQVSLVFHDAFLPQEQWGDLVPQSWSNVYLDTHIYHVFMEDQLQLSDDQHINKTCADGERLKQFNYRTPTICGEFSLATTDCAGWLNGFQRGTRWDGTYLTGHPIVPGATCQGQEDMSTWSDSKRAFMKRFAMAQFQAYEMASGWIFWNFKTERSDAWNFMKLSNAGIIPNPPAGWDYYVCSK